MAAVPASSQPLDFSCVRDARMRPDDLAKMLKCSRVTASLWVNGRSQPHALHRDKVGRLLAAIRRALQAGDLPVPHDVTRRERGLWLQKTLVPHVKAVLEETAAR